jgi:hypothetical protein
VDRSDELRPLLLLFRGQYGVQATQELRPQRIELLRRQVRPPTRLELAKLLTPLAGEGTQLLALLRRQI